MSAYFYTALENLKMYNGSGAHLLLFAAALICLCFCRQAGKYRWLLLGYSLIIGFLFFFPYTAKIIMEYCVEEAVYWRMLWLLQVPVVIAYAGALLAGSCPKRLLRVLLFVGCAALIILGGNNIYIGEGARYEAAENLSKLPDEVCRVCDVLLADAGEDGAINAVLPNGLAEYAREYSARIVLVFGRNAPKGKKAKRIYDELASMDPSIEAVTKYARKLDCNYIVLWDDQWNEQMEERGYEIIGQVEQYLIFRDTQTE